MTEEAPALVSDKPASGLSRNTLKYIAIVAMVIDHTAHAFVPLESWLYILMRFVGRITGPVMFYAAAEGYHHTKNINRYMARLGIFAVISYFPFMYFTTGGHLANLSFNSLNVIYTIFLGVTAIRIRRELKNPVIKTLLIAGLFVLSIPGDWSTTGMMMMLALDYYYGNFKNQAFSYCVIVLLGAGVVPAATSLIQTLAVGTPTQEELGGYAYAAISAGMFLPILLLRFYNREKGSGGRFSKWFFYIFYPLHLLVLGLLQYII